MSTQVELGSIIEHEGSPHVVVRITDSTTWFQEPGEDGESYLLEEKYVELREVYSNQVGFKILTEIKHPFTKLEGRHGLDPRIWKRV